MKAYRDFNVLEGQIIKNITHDTSTTDLLTIETYEHTYYMEHDQH